MLRHLMPRLATKLAHVRAQKGFTQERLAQVSGVSRDTIHRLERGSSPGRLATWYRLARALEVEVDALLEDAA